MTNIFPKRDDYEERKCSLLAQIGDLTILILKKTGEGMWAKIKVASMVSLKPPKLVRILSAALRFC